jgi:hypothetical protein
MSLLMRMLTAWHSQLEPGVSDVGAHDRETRRDRQEEPQKSRRRRSLGEPENVNSTERDSSQHEGVYAEATGDPSGLKAIRRQPKRRKETNLRQARSRVEIPKPELQPRRTPAKPLKQSITTLPTAFPVDLPPPAERWKKRQVISRFSDTSNDEGTTTARDDTVII